MPKAGANRVKNNVAGKAADESKHGYFVTPRGTVCWGVGLYGDRRLTDEEVTEYKENGTVPPLKLDDAAAETESTEG